MKKNERRLRTYIVELRSGNRTRKVTVKALNLHLMHQHIREHYPQYDVPGADSIRRAGKKDRHTRKDDRGFN